MAIATHFNLDYIQEKTHNLEHWYFVVPAVIVLFIPGLVLVAAMVLFSMLIMLVEPVKLLARRRHNQVHPSWYYVFSAPDDFENLQPLRLEEVNRYREKVTSLI